MIIKNKLLNKNFKLNLCEIHIINLILIKFLNYQKHIQYKMHNSLYIICKNMLNKNNKIYLKPKLL